MSLRTHFFLSLAAVGCVLCTVNVKANDTPSDCPAEPSPLRLDFRHIEANGIGYLTGYSTIALFSSLPEAWHRLTPFIDMRGHVFNDGKFASNLGVGVRYLSNRIYGANIYYDFRQARKGIFNQIAFGLETLGTRWDFRINGYLPVGRLKTPSFDKRYSFLCKFKEFSGNSILVDEINITRKKIEFAMQGADAEVGFHLLNPRDNFDLVAAIGPYYFHGQYGKYAAGGKARLAAQINDYIAFEGNFSYDNLFRAIVQGQVTVSIPFGKKKKVFKNRASTSRACDNDIAMSRRLVQPIQRDEIIVASRHHKKSEHRTTGLAINPATGLPYNALFVNNANLNAGTGTIENPFNQLVLAQLSSIPGDLIYVFTGDGTTTGMAAGFQLKNNQILMGSGLALNVPSNCGTITLPALQAGAPSITNAGNVIMLASNNILSGLNILGTSGAGIFGFNITNIQIQNNQITNPFQNSGIQLQDISGTVTITQNDMVGSFGTNMMGIQIVTIATQPNIVISQNAISDYYYGIRVYAENMSVASSTATIANNFLQNNQVYGASVETDFTALLAATVQGNAFVGNGTAGLNASTTSNPTNFLCLNLLLNASDTGYTLTNTSPSTFNVISPDSSLFGVQANNVGTITSTGVTFVPPGSPNCP